MPLLLGMLGIAYVGLNLYGIAGGPIQHSAYAPNAFALAKGILAGMTGVVAFCILPANQNVVEEQALAARLKNRNGAGD